MASDIQQTPFVKQLAANDRPTRDAALASLRTFLSGRRTLPPIELLKLQKGLFYTMWHSDRPLPQQALASSLAALALSIFPDNRIPFLRAFWQTIAREWTGIDVLRMEKFLLLVRRYVGTTFELCKEAGWESEVVRAQLEVLAEVPLNVEDMRLPNGLRFHVTDIFVDELERAGALEEGRKGVELEVLLEPLRRLAKESPTKAVRIKAKEALADERLPGNEKKVEDVEMVDEGWGGFDD